VFIKEVSKAIFFQVFKVIYKKGKVRDSLGLQLERSSLSQSGFLKRMMNRTAFKLIKKSARRNASQTSTVATQNNVHLR
jgi:hypothetical protein